MWGAVQSVLVVQRSASSTLYVVNMFMTNTLYQLHFSSSTVFRKAKDISFGVVQLAACNMSIVANL